MSGYAVASSGGPTQRQVNPPYASSAQLYGTRASWLARVGVLAFAAVALVLLALAPLSQAKEVSKYFGNLAGTGSAGGEFNFGFSAAVAVNSTGAGPANQGDIYVVDGSNQRIERFDKNDKFVSAWGKDVIAATVNERQRLIVEATGGTFSLTFNGTTTEPIPYHASASTVDNALDVLSSVGADANVEVGGGPSFEGDKPYIVTFTGALAATDLPQITLDSSHLEGTATVTTLADGTAATSDTGTGFEICTAAAECKAGVASGGNGTTGGDGALNNPQSVAVDGDTGDVYVSDRNNHRVDVYDGEGHFIASFGWDVVESGPDNTGTGYEICKASEGDVCKVGIAGSGAGQYGTGGESGTFGIAVSQPDGSAATGTVFLADSGNRRVNTYQLDGTAPASFGSSANFGFGFPTRIAVDSRGIVYASNSNNGAEIERYDTGNADDGGIGFLAPILAAQNEKQKVEFEKPEPGDLFSLSCPAGGATGAIEYAHTTFEISKNIEKALLAACSGTLSVTEEDVVTFSGSLGGADLPPISCSYVSGAGSCAISTVVDGHPGALPEGFGTATHGLAVDPDSDGAGPETDVLYVLRAPRIGQSGQGAAIVQQFGPVNEPGLAAAPTAEDTHHGTGASLFSDATFNLALDYSTGRLFVPSREDAVGTAGRADRVYVIDNPLSAPVIDLNPVTGKTDSAATFSATVNPTGGLIRCGFQYSTDPGFSTFTDVAAPGCASFSPDGGFQTVSQKATGLDPSTHYYVRLRVTRTFDSSDVTTSSSTFFDTEPAPPVIADVGATQIADTSTRMVATIDPRNSATGYVFQYGPTPALGSSTAPLDIGGGTTPITVSQVVSGLQPDTTYYFRALATNLTGTTTSSSHTLHTRATPLPLPEDRRWEQVSPVEKNFGDVDSGFGRVSAGVSLNGDAVAFCDTDLFGEPASQMTDVCAPYISRRTPTGWQTPNDLPPYCHVDPVTGDENGFRSVIPSPDYSHILIRQPETADCPLPLLDPAAPLLPEEWSRNYYLQDPNSAPPTYQLLNPRLGGERFAGNIQQETYAGGSRDFGHVVYLSFNNQTDPPDSPSPGQFQKIYDWRRQGQGDCSLVAGCLTLASKDTGGQPFESSSAIPGLGPIGGNPIVLASAVSANGERIFFANPVESFEGECEGPGCEVYMREGDATTYDVSTSECTFSCGAPQTMADDFLSATPSGDDAFFTSCAKLTDESSAQGSCTKPWSFGGAGENGSKLYRWRQSDAPGHRLVDLTVDHEPSDGEQPDFRGLLGESDDGNVAYFVAAGQIVSGKTTAPGEKLYRWSWNGGSPTIDYLGPYQTLRRAGDSADVNWMQQRRLVTPSGSDLMIYTKLRLDPAADHDEDADVYRWDESEGWACVSCQLPGAPSAGDVDLTEVWLSYYPAFFPELSSLEPRSFMSDNGKRIFFGTPDALVPQDVNGEAGCPAIEKFKLNPTHVNLYQCEDVYEWHDGTVSLISSGTSDEPSRLISSTLSGNDVFFYTRQRLVGWDKDNNTDIYDARVGGGFPEPPPQPPTCEGDSCRGEGSSSPSATGAGTAVFQGPGNPAPKKHRPKGRKHHKRLHHKHHRRTARHNRRAGR